MSGSVRLVWPRGKEGGSPDEPAGSPRGGSAAESSRSPGGSGGKANTCVSTLATQELTGGTEL